MSEKLNFNVIFCEFDPKLGPVPKYSYPDVDRGFGLSVASTSMGFIRSDEVSDSKSLAFLPLSRDKKKGIVRNFEWYDPALRGGVGTGSLTLIFNEADDLIYYKYIKDFEILFDDAIESIKTLKTAKAQETELYEEIKKIHDTLLNKLKELSDQEKGTSDVSTAFPEEDKNEIENTYAFKIVVCGDPACGKTSTILKFTESAFRRTYIPTIGVNITRKQEKFEKKLVTLVLWDIAGQMKFKLMRRSFYEGAEGVLLLFDLTRRSTFKSIPDWYRDIKSGLSSHIDPVVLLCGNKKDLMKQREINEEEAKALANQLDIEYIEISALTGENLDQAFLFVAKKLIKA